MHHPAPLRLDLAGAWTLRPASGGDAIPAIVPGCVHTDLMAAGRLPPLFWRGNELAFFEACTQDWTYEREFQADPVLLAHDAVTLRCEGLDTLASVAVNGVVVIEADNMFRTWEAEVRARLRPGANRIAITLRSPLPYMEERTRSERVLPQWNLYHPRFAGRGYVRKMACAFGWDWGPMVPTAGIWKGLALIAHGPVRFADVRVSQDHSPGRVAVAVEAVIDGAPGPVVTAELSLDGVVVARSSAAAGTRLVLGVDQPRLWWPNGLGEQPLYRLRLTLAGAGGGVADTWERRLGLRTLVLRREADAWGESFGFMVNGLRIFAKGANWIPASIFPHDCDGKHCLDDLDSAAAAGMNMLRAWGGGIYESDAFYDRCDELGLLVWQDCMFACGTYPAFDPAFLANVEREIIDNARRLRDHPSLALWCGNNELEQGLVADDWTDKAMSWADYAQLFDRLLPGVLGRESPATPYWPCSPHSPLGNRHDHGNHRCGDAHAWSVWFGDQSFESQRTWRYRFQSEFGFQSFPEPRTVEAFTEPADRNLTSYVMDLHQRSKRKGNRQIYAYLLEWFRVPKDFASSLWLTQLTQALCIQFAAEHTRRQQPRTEGCLYWQLNDMWPAATWSSVDCFGRWKALQHLARRFFAPVLVSGCENTANGEVAVHVSNHRREPIPAAVRWRATDCRGGELARGAASVQVPAQADACALVIAGHPLRTRLGEQLVHGDAPSPTGALGMYRGDLDLLIWLEAEVAGEVVSRNLVLFARPKHLQLVEPHIACSVAPGAAAGEFRVTLRAAVPALWTRLGLAGADAAFSDNWLHLDGSNPVTVIGRPATAMDAAELSARLEVQSLIGC